MRPLAAIYHPGGRDPAGYPVSLIDVIASWTEDRGSVAMAVCVTTDGALRMLDADRVQVVDRVVAESIVAATSASEQQWSQQNTIPPRR